MDILINDAKLLGKDGIRLTTMLDNDRGFHLYLKKGFVYQGDVDNVFAKGEIITERDMFLPLKCTSTSHQSQISRVP